MPPDFSRDVRCVLGLPFDAVTEAEAEAALRRAVQGRERCLLSTPNLNFAVGCLGDADFRASVLQSDLNLADGWPVVAVARLVGAKLPERVAGSSLFERLVASPQRPPLAVYFFGGPDGAAEAACRRLNTSPSGAVCAGFEAPGFGSVDEMSSAAHLSRLNAARPDFVVVALGARKGQAWIRRNLERIEAPLISHLGAVVNFAAGAVSRAPRWVQASRLEWLWRIKEEPNLWKRYAVDGLVLLRLLVTRVLPLALRQRLFAPGSGELSRAALTTRAKGASGAAVLALVGAWTRDNASPLRSAFATQAASREAVVLDLSGVTHLDASVIGLFALLHGWQSKIGAGWEVVQPSGAARRALRLACAEYLLHPAGTK